MNKYKLYYRGPDLSPGIQNVETGDSFIEEDPQYYREYQEWLAAGNTPSPEFTQAELDVQVQAEADRLQRIADIAANLPSWAQVETAISNITDLAGAKAFLAKLSRVVYWNTKHTLD